MTLLNLYSLFHLLIWFSAGRMTRMSWLLFLVLSLGWEILEWVLPFEFAEEWIGNKVADVGINMLGFHLGKRFSIHTPTKPD